MPLVESFCCLCFPEEGLVRPYREAPGLVEIGVGKAFTQALLSQWDKQGIGWPN